MFSYMAKSYCRYDQIKDLEVGRLFWIVHVGPVNLQGSLQEGYSSTESDSRGCVNGSMRLDYCEEGALMEYK